MKRRYLMGLCFLLIFLLPSTLWAAGNIKKIWKGEATLQSTNGYGGATADCTGVYSYTSGVDLETDGYEAAIVYVEYDSAGTTDNFDVGIFDSVDGTDFSTDPAIPRQFSATAGADTQGAGIFVYDMQHFRVGVKSSGGTDTFDYRIRWDAWRHYYE